MKSTMYEEDTVFDVDPIQYLVYGNWLGNGI